MNTNPCTSIANAMDRLFPVKSGWEHGTCMTLLGKLTLEQALWRPATDRKCIWEIVGHMQQWRRTVAARFAHDPDATIGPEWPALPSAEDKAELARLWAEELTDLERTQEALLTGLRALDPAEPYPHTNLETEPHWIAGLSVQIHDSYHLGQIALLRALQGLPAVE